MQRVFALVCTIFLFLSLSACGDAPVQENISSPMMSFVESDTVVDSELPSESELSEGGESQTEQMEMPTELPAATMTTTTSVLPMQSSHWTTSILRTTEKSHTSVATKKTTRKTMTSTKKKTKTTTTSTTKKKTTKKTLVSTTTVKATTTSSKRIITSTTAKLTTTWNEALLAEFNLPKTTLAGSNGDKNWIYTLGDEYLTVRETTIQSGRVGEAIEIVHITDAHISNSYAPNTHWQRCLRYGGQYDYTVATGDIIETCKDTLLRYFKSSIADYPRIMVGLGNHEWTGNGVTNSSDKTEQYATLQSYWPNDVRYSSVVVKNRVMLIQLDNSQHKFLDSQVPQLKADIDTARKNGYTVLLFYHIPLRSYNMAEMNLQPLLRYDASTTNTYNFAGSQLFPTTTATKQIYELIRNNADVIRGAFCGHLHDAIYSEMIAKTPDGTSAIIPQYVGYAAKYGNGHVLKITVK